MTAAAYADKNIEKGSDRPQKYFIYWQKITRLADQNDRERERTAGDFPKNP